MNYYSLLAIILFIYMNLWFFISIIKKRNDVADIAWGLGFILLSWTSLIIEKSSIKGFIVSMLVTIWGLRLAWHIYNRNKKKTEDSRYLEWRKQWGKWFFLRSYFQVYILQGLLLYIIAWPILFINHNSSGNIILIDILGIIVWIVGFIFESVGDWQLKKFIRNPTNKGKIMRSGLWKYSRHPNYFGEITQWWGIFIITLSIRDSWLTIFGPLTITYLILFVSGVPLLEKKYQGRRDFEDYKMKTSILIPFPPKK